MNDMQNISLLDPSLIGDDSEDMADPRKRLLRSMSLQAMQSLMGNDSDTESMGDRGGGQDAQTPVSGQGGGMLVGPVGAASDDRAGANSAGSDAGDNNGTGGLVRASLLGDRLARMTGDEASALGIMPPGFDDNGIPTENGATGPKNAAAARLQRADETLYPSTGKGRILRAATTMLPAAIGLIGGGGAAGAGAATGAVAGANELQKRRLAERSFAAEQYQFEAGREEREKEQAIRERVAMATIEANKAYRTLMASISSRKADISQENADRAAANAGFVVKKGEDGVNHLVPLNSDQLSAMNQAKLGVEKAQQELDAAKTKAIPEQIKIAEDRLKIQQGMLQRALAALELQKEGMDLRFRQEDYKETGPTTTSRNTAQQANQTVPHIIEFKALVHQAAQKGFIGPLAGRVMTDFLAGKVGSTGNDEADYLLGELMSNSKLLTGAALKTHFNGRGISLYGSFEAMLAAKRSEQELMGEADGLGSYIQSYSKMGDWSGAQEWTPLRPGPRAAAASKLKKGQGNSSGNIPASIPKGARIRHFSELGQ